VLIIQLIACRYLGINAPVGETIEKPPYGVQATTGSMTSDEVASYIVYGCIHQ
jgi:hypothetical protein